MSERSVGPQPDDSEFLRSVLASSADCIKVLDLDGNLIFMSEGGKNVMEVGDFNSIHGCPWPDFWQGSLRDAARSAVETAKRGGTGRFQGPATTMAGTPRYWDVQVTPIAGADGKPASLLSVSRDITASRSAEEAARDQQTLNTLIMNSTRDCVVVLDLQGRIQFVSPGGIEAMEIKDVSPMIGADWSKVWTGADRAAAQAAIAAARAGGTGRFQGFCPTLKGQPKWWDVIVTPVAGDDGAPARIVSAGRDITELRGAEERSRLLMEELTHRVKNTLAVVSAIATQTLNGNKNYADASKALTHRLHALADAHDALVKTNWTATPVRVVVDNAARLHANGDPRRFHITGPDVTLGPRGVLSFALVLHELGTNAVKYGALSTAEGRVDVSWKLDETGEEPRFHFDWQELDGPAVVTPTRIGFGTRLIQQSLGPDFGAAVDLAYRPDGVVFSVDASLRALQRT